MLGYKFGGSKQRIREASSITYKPPISPPKPIIKRVIPVKPRISMPANIEYIDSDYDGLINSKDACPYSRVGVEVDVQGCEIKKEIIKPAVNKACSIGVLEGVNFHTGSARLTEHAKSILNGIASKLNSCNVNKVTIVGHTDSDGSLQSNLILSLNRAVSVKEYLVSQGVHHRRLGADGRGESQPRSDNLTQAGKALNRRVDLMVR
jgi:outer membrane protein OmpA-like peptidoglycan-associated protein